MKPGHHLTPDEVVERARDLLRSGRDQESFELLSEAIERHPADPEIRLLYATALVGVRPDDAPWEIASAIQLDLDDPWRLTRAASLMFGLGEFESARAYASRAADLAPAGFAFEAELANLGGKLAAMQGQLELAEEALRAAVAAEPDEASFVGDLASFLADHGHRAEALALLDDAAGIVADSRKLDRLRSRL